MIKKSTIACVVPTIRDMTAFLNAWENIFSKHAIQLIIINDSDEMPTAEIMDFYGETYYINGEKCPKKRFTLESIFGENNDLISNKNAGVRNFGFAIIAKKFPDIEYIFTTDDDCYPIGDPIQDHFDSLQKRVPLSWFSTTLINSNTDYMRGFPYGIRNEAEVILSHGVWEQVPDRDAPTQLIAGAEAPVSFYKGPIPRDTFFPMCGMNIMFKRKLLPYVYFAPVGQFKGAERFDDIWAGIPLKSDIDNIGYAVVSGYAQVKHSRASNVFNSLEKEATGIKLNEEFYKLLQGHFSFSDLESLHPFFRKFMENRRRWENFIESIKQ